MTILRSYKIMHDNGFAPNPYAGYLTLATCKPLIRQSHEIGHWLAGFAAVGIEKKRYEYMVGEEPLIFLALINKKVKIKEYYLQYPQKRPGCCPNADNIYKWENGQYQQLQNPFHDEGNFEHDLKGENVLIADEFYYFGEKAIHVPTDIRPNVPKGQAAYGQLTEGQQAEKFINWVRKQASKFSTKTGRLAQPHAPSDIDDPKGSATGCNSNRTYKNLQEG